MKKHKGNKILDASLREPRENPAFNTIKKKHDRDKLGEYISEYALFLNESRIPIQVVKNAIGIIQEQNPKGYTILVDKEGNNVACIRWGKLPVDAGVLFLGSHTDSPCLRLKVRPLIQEWGIDTKYLHAGVEFRVRAYGGINEKQWLSRTLDLIGARYFKDNKIRFFEPKPFVCNDISIHIDKRDQYIDGYENLVSKIRIDTGCITKKDVLQNFGFTDETEFAKSRFYLVPQDKASQCGYLLSGYGHDDRVCVYASIKALLEVPQPEYTTVVFAMNSEECSKDTVGNLEKLFFKKIIFELEDRCKANIYKVLLNKSLFVSADVDVAGAAMDEDYLDIYDSAKLGFGMFIDADFGYEYTNSETSKITIAKVEDVLNKSKIVFQFIGDSAKDHDGVGWTMSEYIGGFMETINIGVPAVGLHGPVGTINVGDLYQTIKGYQAIISNFGSIKND